MEASRFPYLFGCALLGLLFSPIEVTPLSAQSLGRPRMQFPVQMSGRVLMENGTPPPEPVPVELVCGGGARMPVGLTNSKGGFVVRRPSEARGIIVDARQPVRVVDPGIFIPRSMDPPGAVSPGCAIEARLAGFQSSSLTVPADSAAVNLGTIFLRRVAGVEGTTVSGTTSQAPKDARRAFEKAKSELEKDRRDQACAELEKAVRIFPQFAAAWFELGRIYQGSKAFDDARHAFDRSIAADPRFIKPYLQLATILNMEKKWRELADVTATAIKLNPFDFPATYTLNAMGNFRLGDMKSAEASARQAVKLDTGQVFPEAEYTLGLILGVQGDYKGAVEHLRKYLQLAPDSPIVEEVKRQLAEFEKSAQTVSRANR